MITGRVIGGIIALFGGFMVVLAVLLNTAAIHTGGHTLVAWIVNLIIGLWAIIGGILGIFKQGTGGLIALVAGLAASLCEILYYLNPLRAPYLYQYMPLETWLVFVIPYITLEGIIMAVGGIIILASKK
jgi:hypothetical protein